MNLTLSDEVALLRAQVDYLLERLADHPTSDSGPVRWARLDSEQAADQWVLLIAWVDWLRDRYGLHESVPACWYAHAPLVEELSALRTAWAGAFLSADARPGDPIAWHEILDRTIGRVRRWDRTGCSDGTHRADLPICADTDLHHRERWVHEDVSGRAGVANGTSR
ncbi:MAG: hypothetical protein NVS3B26_13820 [Mycobacteriales bacterium]